MVHAPITNRMAVAAHAVFPDNKVQANGTEKKVVHEAVLVGAIWRGGLDKESAKGVPQISVAEFKNLEQITNG